jgi:two-component system phosphate regulon response regulator PhoB
VPETAETALVVDDESDIRDVVADPVAPERSIRVGPIQLDPETHRAWVEQVPLILTVTEFKLLADLIQAKGRVRTRDRLLTDVWGYDAEVLSRTVDTHVRRLRDKLGSAAPWLETVRGVGYRIREPELA